MKRKILRDISHWTSLLRRCLQIKKSRQDSMYFALQNKANIYIIRIYIEYSVHYIRLRRCIFITADRLSDDVFNSEIDGDLADDFALDGNNLDVSRVLDNLREEIKFDESVAMKSAMLLKLLEVCTVRNG